MRRTDHGLEQAKLATLTDFLVANGVDDAGADGGALDGWTVKTEPRSATSMGGARASDTYYFNAVGTRFRSKTEVLRYFTD